MQEFPSTRCLLLHALGATLGVAIWAWSTWAHVTFVPYSYKSLLTKFILAVLEIFTHMISSKCTPHRSLLVHICYILSCYTSWIRKIHRTPSQDAKGVSITTLIVGTTKGRQTGQECDGMHMSSSGWEMRWRWHSHVVIDRHIERDGGGCKAGWCV
jgi:hypothetical protein